MAKRPSKPPANGATSRSGVYFLSVSVENVRCFKEKQTLDLSDGKGGPARWTILLGDNGTGKTTLLQAMVVLAEHLWMQVDDDGLRRSYESVIALHSFLRDKAGPSRLTSTFLEGGPLAGRSPTWSEATVGSLSVQRVTHGVTASGPRPHLHDRFLTLPLCCAYGAGRRLAPVALTGAAKSHTATLFSDEVYLRNAEEWLLLLDYTASKPAEGQPRQQERLRQVCDLLTNKLLPEITDIHFIAGEGAHPSPRVEFQTPYGWVPLRSLGYGYQGLIAWVVDFASRMMERYPDSPDPLSEPAVVLVDEIDLHLHPQWQRKLVGFLTERFPNTQFIVTAHSPLVVQAATDANLAVLRREGDQVIIDNDAKAIRGWRIDQIYTSDLFGLPSARPPDLEPLLARRKELLSQPRLTKRDEAELRQLEERIGDLPTGESAEQIEMLKLLRRSLDVLDKERAERP